MGKSVTFCYNMFPNFDPNTMLVTAILVWVHLLNPSLHFWHISLFEDIGNTLGSYIKTEIERAKKGLCTYTNICVEIDLTKGLPDKM